MIQSAKTANGNGVDVSEDKFAAVVEEADRDAVYHFDENGAPIEKNGMIVPSPLAETAKAAEAATGHVVEPEEQNAADGETTNEAKSKFSRDLETQLDAVRAMIRDE
jgi:hypothetical protein